MSGEALVGTLVGSAIGVPEAGEVLGAINTGSKALLCATKDIPGLGDLIQGVDSVMTEVKHLPVLGDIVDAFL